MHAKIRFSPAAAVHANLVVLESKGLRLQGLGNQSRKLFKRKRTSL